MVAFVIITGVIQRTKNHLPCGFRFRAFDFLNRKHLVIQWTGTIHHQMLFRHAVSDFNPVVVRETG